MSSSRPVMKSSQTQQHEDDMTTVPCKKVVIAEEALTTEVEEEDGESTPLISHHRRRYKTKYVKADSGNCNALTSTIAHYRSKRMIASSSLLAIIVSLILIGLVELVDHESSHSCAGNSRDHQQQCIRRREEQQQHSTVTTTTRGGRGNYDDETTVRGYHGNHHDGGDNMYNNNYEYEPELVVLDLDATLWDREMYAMKSMPTKTIIGDLNGRGEGVVGVICGTPGEEVRLYDGSLIILQKHYVDNEYPNTKFLFASSADTPFAEQVAVAVLKLLEVVPGWSIWDAVITKDWQGQDYNQIGRQPSKGLSSNKAETHFPNIRAVTHIRYDRMLFFDDCIWSDNVGMVQSICREPDTHLGPAAVRTQNGFTVTKWNEGLQLYNRQYLNSLRIGGQR